MSGRVGVISLGCSKNRVNSEQMMFLLREAGYFVTGEIDGSDFVLLNTCGFIESAKAEAVETILELAAAKEKGEIGKLIVAGCLPERQKEDILSELPEIDAVVGTGSFDDIVSVIRLVSENAGYNRFFGDIDAPVSETDRIISTSKVWAYLKIAEGCDNRCAYCCIPYIRGKYRSRSVENIVKEAKKLSEAGIQELILVAQDLTSYGCDIYGEPKLAYLLTELTGIKKNKWIRLHYMYPDEFNDEIIEIIAKSDKILKYLDIPIQHINNDILRNMNRRGTGDYIKELIKKLRERIPGVVLRTSLITGLPGEGEKEFAELCEFLEEYEIERVGVFAYSPEQGTAAARMERPSKKTAQLRAEKLLELQSRVMQSFLKSRIGSVVTVLVEDFEPCAHHTTFYATRSFAESPDVDGYIHVRVPDDYKSVSSDALISPNSFAKIRITGFKNGELVGEPV